MKCSKFREQRHISVIVSLCAAEDEMNKGVR